MPQISRFQYQQRADPTPFLPAISPPVTFDPANGFPWVRQPDFAPGPARLRWEGFVTPVHTALPSLPLADPVAFLPTFPDFPARIRQPLVQEGWVTKEHVGLPNFPIPNLAWNPIYPDFVRVKPALQWQGWQIPQSTFQQNFQVVFDPSTGFPWTNQPDFALAKQRLWWEGFVTPVHPALPSFPVPALAWAPTYPDFARGAVPLWWQGWVTPTQPSLPSFPVPTLSWAPQYADFARPGLWSVRDYAETYMPPWAAFISVVSKGSYIPQFRRRRK